MLYIVGYAGADQRAWDLEQLLYVCTLLVPYQVLELDSRKCNTSPMAPKHC